MREQNTVKERNNEKGIWQSMSLWEGLMVKYLGDSVLSDLAFSLDFSFLAVDTNKSHKYQLVIRTVIKFLSCLYGNSLMGQ